MRTHAGLKTFAHFEAVHSYEEVFKKHYLKSNLINWLYAETPQPLKEILCIKTFFFRVFLLLSFSLCVQANIKNQELGCRHLSVENK